MTMITTNQYHIINLKLNDINQLLFSSINKVLINYNSKNSSLIFSTILNKKLINTTEILINNCYENKTILKRNTKEQYRFGRSSIYLFIYLNN